MINSPSGVGLQAILTSCNPTFVWDAFRAGTCLGKGLGGTGTLLMTLTDNDSEAANTLWNWGDNRLVKMPASTSAALGIETVLGPCGEFYGGTITNYHTWTSSKMGYIKISSTPTSSWAASGTDYPDILKNASGSDHCKVTYADTSQDAVNNVIVERSTTRSASYSRDFSILIKSTTNESPVGNIELGWNVSSFTEITSTPRFRKLPNSNWYIASIIVPAHATDTAGYSSIMFKANTGIWHTACPTFTNKYAEFEYITRFGKATTGTRGKWDVHTTNAELKLKSCGWLAMSVVLPDRSVSNGHLDYAGAANYKLLGMFNLDCGTYRLRVSMSDTYDHLVVNMGTTSAVNFAYLDGLSDWDDFAAMGIVVCWEINNGNKYATLYINGEKLDSVYNPVDWYPDDLTTGTAYIGILGADSTPAEAWISRVAYGTNPLHRSYARTLSYEMKKLCRGAQL
jgi:hypothetical protein